MLAIVKPLASHPANSERYVVCHQYGGHPPLQVIDTIESMIRAMAAAQPISGFVRWETMCSDQNFMDYIRQSNSKYDANQLAALEAILKYINHSYVFQYFDATQKLYILPCFLSLFNFYFNMVCRSILPEFDQVDIAQRCLTEWQLPLLSLKRSHDA